jgi:hypothetical protein
VDFLYFFDLVRFAWAQLTSSPPFFLPGGTSPLANTVIPPRCVTLPSHGAKTSSLHLAASASSFGNTSFCRLPSRAKTEAMNPYHHRQPPCTYHPTSTIHCYKKVHINLNHSPHHSIASPFCLLSTQRTTPSKFHPPLSFPLTIVPRPSSICTTTFTITN